MNQNRKRRVRIPIEPHFAGDYQLEYDGKYITLHGRDNRYTEFQYTTEPCISPTFEKMVLIPIVEEARRIECVIEKVTESEIVISITPQERELKPFAVEFGIKHGNNKRGYKIYWTSWKRYRTMHAALQGLRDLKKNYPNYLWRPVHNYKIN